MAVDSAGGVYVSGPTYSSNFPLLNAYSTSISGGLDFTRASLEKALGVSRATDIINRVAPARASQVAVQGVADLEPRQVFNLLRHEQPQTIALLLSFIPADKAALILALLPADPITAICNSWTWL